MNAMNNSRRLRQRIEQMLPELTASTSAIFLHPRLSDIYVEFLITVHQMVRATVPLMRAALRRCQELEADDPVAAAMVPYFEQHIREEMHHDDWLLEDLEFLGVPRAEVLRRMPSSAVASLIGGHYYWIFHHHPVAKLGQIAVVEGYPPSVEAIDLMVERTGFARPAFRTLEKHCHLDVNHRDDFDAALDAMPLQEEHFAIIEASARHTVRTGARAYREVVARAAVPARRADLTEAHVGDNGHYRLEDAEFGASFQLGEQEQFLLLQCDGRQSHDDVCRAFGNRFGAPLSRQDLDEFLNLARAEHLFADEGA
jgi:hypothetical protein